jgi:hypothetical protein
MLDWAAFLWNSTTRRAELPLDEHPPTSQLALPRQRSWGTSDYVGDLKSTGFAGFGLEPEHKAQRI